MILYELLTGSTPLEKQKFKDAAFAEILRLINDEVRYEIASFQGRERDFFLEAYRRSGLYRPHRLVTCLEFREQAFGQPAKCGIAIAHRRHDQRYHHAT